MTCEPLLTWDVVAAFVLLAVLGGADGVGVSQRCPVVALEVLAAHVH